MLDPMEIVRLVFAFIGGSTAVGLYRLYVGGGPRGASVRAKDAETQSGLAAAVRTEYALLVKSLHEEMKHDRAEAIERERFLSDRIRVLEEARAKEQSERFDLMTSNADLMREHAALEVENKRLQQRITTQDDILASQAILIEQLRERIRVLEGKPAA